MSRGRPRTTRGGQAGTALTPAQRDHLRRQARGALVPAAALGALSLFLLAVVLSPARTGASAAMIVVPVVMGAISVLLFVVGAQCWRDLRRGAAVVRRARLRDIYPRRGSGWSGVFDGIGGLAPPSRSPLAVPADYSRLGEVVKVTYSPHSRTLWDMRPYSDESH